MKHFNLCLLGFGNVGRALARWLQEKRNILHEQYDLDWRIPVLTNGWPPLAPTSCLKPPPSILKPVSLRSITSARRWKRGPTPSPPTKARSYMVSGIAGAGGRPRQTIPV
jgi:hypothetical protein